MVTLTVLEFFFVAPVPWPACLPAPAVSHLLLGCFGGTQGPALGEAREASVTSQSSLGKGHSQSKEENLVIFHENVQPLSPHCFSSTDMHLCVVHVEVGVWPGIELGPCTC